MVISEKQLQMLFQILIDSLTIVGSFSPFKFDSNTRKELANEILNQQYQELKDVK